MWGRRVLNPKAVVKANVPTLVSVKQETATKLTATLAAPVEKVDLADVALAHDESHAVIAVKSVTVDTADATKLSIETYVDMIDGKSYTLTYTAQDEAKTVSTATFTATDGKIASFALSTATIPVNKATTIKYSALDANGIVIYEKPIDDKANGIDIDVVTTAANLDGAKLTLYEVGDTAKVTVSYHTYNYDAQGNETGMFKNEFTVTAVNSSVVVSGVKYTIVDDDQTIPAWENLTVKTRIAMNEPEPKYARFQIKDSNGDDITSECEYTVESSDANIILASGVANGAVSLVPVKEGSAYLVLKNKENKTETTLPITVIKERTLATFTLDQTSVAIAGAANDEFNPGGTVSIPFSAKDQYGDDIKVSVEDPQPKTDVKQGKITAVQTAGDVAKGTITISTEGDVPAGTYTYSVTARAGETYRTRTFTVIVKETRNAPSAYALQFVKGAGAVSGSAATKNLNTTVSKDSDLEPTVISVNLVEKRNSVITGSAKGITVKSIKVTGNNGKVYAEAKLNSKGALQVATSAAVVSEGAIGVKPGNTLPENAKGHLLDITAVSCKTGDTFVKNLPAGSYTVTLMYNTGSGTDKKISDYFKVEDKQPALTATVLKTNSESNNINDVLADKDFVKYVYNGVTQVADDASTVSVPLVYGTKNGKTIVVSKVIVKVSLGKGKYVEIERPINRVFTSTSDWTGIFG